MLAGGVFGFVKYRQVSDQLAELRRDRADREAVAQLAKDYALKSLTYSFEDPDAFFRSVEDGVSQQLKDKYVNATDILKSIMLQAQVTSTGEVLATDPVAQPGSVYQVVVSAHQTTRNLQNPTPKVSIILLQVTVNRVGNAWQVADIGPKAGATRQSRNSSHRRAARPAPGQTGTETVGVKRLSLRAAAVSTAAAAYRVPHLSDGGRRHGAAAVPAARRTDQPERHVAAFRLPDAFRRSRFRCHLLDHARVVRARGGQGDGHRPVGRGGANH